MIRYNAPIWKLFQACNACYNFINTKSVNTRKYINKNICYNYLQSIGEDFCVTDIGPLNPCGSQLRLHLIMLYIAHVNIHVIF